MRLVLKGKNELELQPELPPAAAAPGEVALRVLCCAICRTDARMWREGHRDLVLPRVPGHEIAAVDPLTDRLYTVWPGEVCGNCPACLAGRENLCDKMRIIGFHRDGGLAAEVVVPRESLIPVKDGLDPVLVTFAEPVACLLNPLPRLAPRMGEHALVVGGGVLGMLAALVLREEGCRVTVLEISAEKIARQLPLATAAGVELLQATNRAEFDLAITCCASPAGFAGAVGKLRKGGRLAFFSGLEKNNAIDGNLLNLIHYRELAVIGSYGPRRGDMTAALAFCRRQQHQLDRLIDRLIAPEEVGWALPRVLAGKALKYIVDFRSPAPAIRQPVARPEVQGAAKVVLPPLLADIVREIAPQPAGLRENAQHKADQKIKPLGALGRIEALAVKLAVVSGSLEPRVDCRRLLVFAGDHGVAEEGVSAFPARVTVQMVENFLNGGAAINVFCRHYGIELTIVDIGVNGDFAEHPMLRRMKVARTMPSNCSAALVATKLAGSAVQFLPRRPSS